jgi:light-regulated signal transduction histidine kinase (bacteriophytochrome)
MTHEDVTALKRAERGLARRAEDLERSNAELEQFAYVASHDLQEPLRMVGSYMELLARRFRDRIDETGREFIDFAIDGADRMKRLIQALLEYSRVESRGGDFAPTDCGRILEEALENLSLAIEETGAKITADPLPVVIGDPTQLVQLLQNLVGNAVKFHGEASPEIHVGARREGGQWVLSVSDRGIGIEPEYFERIFIIFQRLHSAAQRPGTGIGLSICKKIVERHGGKMWLESEVGKGSTFHFSLPARKESPT